jgi:hypothetical protein
MGYDRNDCWMTCGERDDKMAELGLGPFDCPWSEIERLMHELNEIAEYKLPADVTSETGLAWIQIKARKAAAHEQSGSKS